MQYFWTWSGNFFGYRFNDLLFTYHGACAGRFVGADIYDSHGNYVGEVMSGSRLLTNRAKSNWTNTPAPLVRGSVSTRASRDVGLPMLPGHEDFPSPESFI